jgi:hypothetical protein
MPRKDAGNPVYALRRSSLKCILILSSHWCLGLPSILSLRSHQISICTYSLTRRFTFPHLHLSTTFVHQNNASEEYRSLVNILSHVTLCYLKWASTMLLILWPLFFGGVFAMLYASGFQIFLIVYPFWNREINTSFRIFSHVNAECPGDMYQN